MYRHLAMMYISLSNYIYLSKYVTIKIQITLILYPVNSGELEGKHEYKCKKPNQG